MSALIRIIVFAICAAISSAAACYGEPLVRHNTDAILILTTVFTVFAGFLVAVITVLGDPALLPEGSWRVVEGRRDGIERGLILHVSLFVSYLLAIGILFAGIIVRDADGVSEVVKIWIGRAYLFVGVMSFLFTFGLAKSMLSFQMARLDAEGKRRRKAAGLKE